MKTHKKEFENLVSHIWKYKPWLLHSPSVSVEMYQIIGSLIHNNHNIKNLECRDRLILVIQTLYDYYLLGGK